jgi:hypothetical protein
MIKFARIAVFTLGLAAVGSVPNSEAAPPQAKACRGHVFRGSAQWTQDPPSDQCGPFSALLVHSTQADSNVVEVIYQFGDTCNNTFGMVFGTGQASVNGDLKRLTMSATVSTSDERSIAVNVTLTGTRGSKEQSGDERTVSASASGTVILDGVNLTGGVTTTNATISRSKC